MDSQQWMKFWENSKVQYQNNSGSMRWSGNCMQHLHDGGACIKELFKTIIDAEGLCAYILENPNFEWKPINWGETTNAPTFLDGYMHMLYSLHKHTT